MGLIYRVSWVVAAVLLLGFALRALGLGHDSLWYDEAGSIHYASQPLGDIAGNALGDAHPPLYFYLQHVWLIAVGRSEYAARYASLLAGVATAAALYPIGRWLGGPALGAVAAAAWALSPFGLYASREVRMYALLALVAVLSTFALMRLTARPTLARFAPYAASVAVLFYLHYFGPVLLAGHLAIALDRGRWRGFALWVGAVAVGGGLFLPWLAAIRDQVGDFGAGKGADAWQILRGAATAFASGFGPDWLGQRRVDDPLMLVVLPVVAGGLVALGLRQRVAAAWLIGPTAAFLALTVDRAEFTPRYLTVVAPGFALALASGLLGLWRAHRPLGAIAGLAALLLTFHALYRQHVDARLWHDDFRSAVAHLAAAERPGQTVVLNPGYFAPVYDYYAAGRWPTLELPARRGLEARPGLEAAVRGHTFVWLVLWQDYYADPDDVVQRWLGERGERIEERRFRGDVRVIGYAIRR
jgi:mannosyltransferase